MEEKKEKYLEKNSDKIEKSPEVEAKEKNSELQEIGAKWLVIGLIGIVASLFIFGWVLSESRKVDYIGLTFTKENFGQIPIYTSPLSGKTVNGDDINFKIALRNNPKNSKIPIVGNLYYDEDRQVYLTIDLDSGVDQCTSESLVGLGQFMDAMGFDIQTGLTSKEKAKEFGKPYVVCENTNGATVLVLTTGNKSEIVQQGNDDCYVLSVNNCELTEVVEKLEIGTLAYMRNEKI